MRNNPAGGASATMGGLIAILLWSLTIGVARSLAEQVGSVTAAAAVYLVSALLALAGLAARPSKWPQIRNLPRRYLVGCGLLFSAYVFCLFGGIGLAANRPQVLEIALLNYLWPVLTLLFSVGLLGRKAGWLLLPGTVFALTGMFFVLMPGTHPSLTGFVENIASNPMAYLLGLSAAVVWALYSTLTCKWCGARPQGAVELFLPATAVGLWLWQWFVSDPGLWSWRAAGEAVYLGSSTYAAYWLWDTAMRRGNILLVSAFSYLTPLFSAIFSCFYLAVMPEAFFWLGCALLAMGSLLSWRSVAIRRA